jgi:hypothetical protein
MSNTQLMLLSGLVVLAPHVPGRLSAALGWLFLIAAITFRWVGI